MPSFWRAAGRDLLDGMLQLTYPAACILCNRLIVPGSAPLCDSCRDELAAAAAHVCPRCSASIGPYENTEGGCQRCRNRSFHFSATIRLGPYEGHLREAILRTKDARGERLADLLGAFWGMHCETQLAQAKADFVIPVPLHWWRRWRRGYNQSESLGRALAARLHLPCRPRWLRRTRNTPKQVEQTPAERQVNVRGAFRAMAKPELKGRSVLLVDDVLTTGSTASEAARTLKHDAGVERVVVAVLAGPHASRR